MDATKLDYTLTASYSPSSRYSEKAFIKNHENQILFSVATVSSQLEPISFDLPRNFGPLSLPQHTQPPYPYPRHGDVLLSPNQHSSPFPLSQEAPLPDVTPYIYDSGSSSYPSNPQPSQPSFHIDSAHEPFHLNLNQDLTAQSLSLSINSALDLAIQTPATPFSSVPSNYNLLRRYHQDQSRQHAQVLQQLTRSRDGRRQSAAQDITGNGVFSASLEITPTGRRAELYHAASSIPMSNIRPHQPRPPEYTLQQTKPFNHYQYPYYNNQDVGYSENDRSEPLDVPSAHVHTSTLEPTSTYDVSTKTMQILSPSTTIALDSSLFAMRSGPRSNAIQSMPHPTTRAFDGVGGTHPSTSLSDMASISSPFTPSGIAKGETRLVEIGSDNRDEAKLKGDTRATREEGMEKITGNYPGTNAKRRDGGQSEVLGSGMSGRPRAADSVIKDGLSPPTKKRKKSKMHECQVCHKNFPRPSGLKTHMNTHNNERPYPCPYPGCNRSFGVRSNAKRHLRTHGVIPPQNTGTQPYVVDFSTPLILEQDGRLDGEGTNSNVGCRDGPEDASLAQRSTRPLRGRGRQFKLRWMPPSSSNKSTAGKGKGKKKSTDSSPVELEDPDVKPSFSRSPSQDDDFLGPAEEDREAEDADGEEDVEMDLGEEGEDRDEDSEDEEVDRSEEEFGASTAMQPRVLPFRPRLSRHSQASSSMSSLSSSASASASTSALSLATSTSPSTFTDESPIPPPSVSPHDKVPMNIPAPHHPALSDRVP